MGLRKQLLFPAVWLTKLIKQQMEVNEVLSIFNTIRKRKKITSHLETEKKSPHNVSTVHPHTSLDNWLTQWQTEQGWPTDSEAPTGRASNYTSAKEWRVEWSRLELPFKWTLAWYRSLQMCSEIAKLWLNQLTDQIYNTEDKYLGR